MSADALEFEWSPEKAKINLEKHNISFLEAATVFNDALAVTFSDPLHSDDEDRSITIGFSSKGRLLFVASTDRGSKTRIITARTATRKEGNFYGKGIQ